MAEKCPTCIFWPGNRMHLEPGRVKEMLEGAIKDEGHIICHSTLPGPQNPGLPVAICKGFEEHPIGKMRSLALRFGRHLGLIREVKYPEDRKNR